MYDRDSDRPFEISSQLTGCQLFANNTHELNDVNDWNFVGFLSGAFTVLLSNQRPEFVEIESRGEAVVAVQVEVSHSDLSEVSRMVLIKVDSMMMHTTGVTATSRMLAVLS